MLSVMACAEEGAASSYTSDPMGLGLDTESDAGTLTPSRLSLAGAADFPASASPHSSAAGLDTPQDARGQGVALVVDAEVTSYLMMGALSPGLKRHSVTLFEGEQLSISPVKPATALPSISPLLACIHQRRSLSSSWCAPCSLASRATLSSGRRVSSHSSRQLLLPPPFPPLFPLLLLCTDKLRKLPT